MIASKMIFKISLGLAFVLFVHCGNDCCKKMKKGGLFPNLADGTKSFDLKINYKDKEVDCGESFSFLEAAFNPTLCFDAQCDKLTLVAVAPDSVDLPPFLIWLVYNIPSDCLRKGFSQNCGDFGATYAVPKPVFALTGYRVVFFLYCQKEDVKDPEKRPLMPLRLSFQVKEHAKRKKLGCPVAAKYFNLTVLDKPINVPLTDLQE